MGVPGRARVGRWARTGSWADLGCVGVLAHRVNILSGGIRRCLLPNNMRGSCLGSLACVSPSCTFAYQTGTPPVVLVCLGLGLGSRILSLTRVEVTP